MNPYCLTNEIWIKSTNDDARVIGLQLMQTNKVFAIQSQHRTSQAHRKRQHEVVFNRLIRFASFEDSQHIVSETTQLLDHRLWKILVGVE